MHVSKFHCLGINIAEFQLWKITVAGQHECSVDIASP